jgi:hypothetical protein
MAGVLKYAAEATLPIPAESTLRGWRKSAKVQTTDGLETYELTKKKRGPPPKLGEQIDFWVDRKCKDALRNGMRLSSLDIKYVG